MKKNKWFGLLIISLTSLCFVGMIIGLALAIKTHDKDDIPESGLGHEIIISPDSFNKPTTGHYIGIKCNSFYSEKIVSFDAFMCQSISERFLEDVDRYLDGYPVFEVYQITDDNTKSTVLINGQKNKFEKKFTLDDLSFLGLKGYPDDIFNSHCEHIKLDISQLEVGQTAAICVSYGFFYYTNNPYNEIQRDNSWCGMRRTLYFYRGENGLSVSPSGKENAISNYEENIKKPLDIGQIPSGDVCY